MRISITWANMIYLTGNKDQVLGSICNFCQVNQIKHEKFMTVSKKNDPKRLKTLYSYLCIMTINGFSLVTSWSLIYFLLLYMANETQSIA